MPRPFLQMTRLVLTLFMGHITYIVEIFCEGTHHQCLVNLVISVCHPSAFLIIDLLLFYVQVHNFQKVPFVHHFIIFFTKYSTQQYCHIEFPFKIFDKIHNMTLSENY